MSHHTSSMRAVFLMHRAATLGNSPVQLRTLSNSLQGISGPSLLLLDATHQLLERPHLAQMAQPLQAALAQRSGQCLRTLLQHCSQASHWCSKLLCLRAGQAACAHGEACTPNPPLLKQHHKRTRVKATAAGQAALPCSRKHLAPQAPLGHTLRQCPPVLPAQTAHRIRLCSSSRRQECGVAFTLQLFPGQDHTHHRSRLAVRVSPGVRNILPLATCKHTRCQDQEYKALWQKRGDGSQLLLWISQSRKGDCLDSVSKYSISQLLLWMEQKQKGRPFVDAPLTEAKQAMGQLLSLTFLPMQLSIRLRVKSQYCDSQHMCHGCCCKKQAETHACNSPALQVRHV